MLFETRHGEAKVIDMDMAVFGRKDLALAEHNLPGHMACRELFELALLFNRLNINGPSHIATQTVVLFETFQALSALVLWTSCTSQHTRRCCGWLSLAQH